MDISRLSTLSLGLAIAVFTLGLAAAPALADPKTDGCHGPHKPTCDDPPSPTPPFVATHEAAVGHELVGCLVCSDEAGQGSGCASGDFFDVGTSHALHIGNDAHAETECGLLECSVHGGVSVDCGHDSAFNLEPQPLVDISGLFALWNPDPKSQGNPQECFGMLGIVSASVSVRPVSGENQFGVQLFFKDAVDITLPGRCQNAASTEINYEASIGPCSSSDTFPPGKNSTATITCSGNTPVTVKHQGGGGVAAKCGCHAKGMLSSSLTMIRIRGL